MVVLVQSAVFRVREKTTLRPAVRMPANGWSVDVVHAGRGVLGYGGFTVIGVFDLVGWPGLGGAELICGLAALAWTMLVLRAQRHDDRWGTATVAYGIAALVASILLGLAALPFAGEGSAVEALGVVPSVLMMIWLARSAHDLAAPRHQPAAQAASGLCEKILMK